MNSARVTKSLQGLSQIEQSTESEHSSPSRPRETFGSIQLVTIREVEIDTRAVVAASEPGGYARSASRPEDPGHEEAGITLPIKNMFRAKRGKCALTRCCASQRS